MEFRGQNPQRLSGAGSEGCSHRQPAGPGDGHSWGGRQGHLPPGSTLGGETPAPPGGAPHGEPARSPQPCGPSEDPQRPAPRPDCGRQPGQRRVPAAAAAPSPSAPGAGALLPRAPRCSLAGARRPPPVVFLPKLVYDVVTCTDGSGLPKAASLLPAPSVVWASSFRPLLSKTMTSTEQSLYYRQWTMPRPSHMDHGSRAEGCGDGFHPRRLLLSGPPQVRAPPRAWARGVRARAQRQRRADSAP